MLATSTGSRNGINNLYQGACSRRNMKLTIKVCCESTSKYRKTAVQSLSSIGEVQAGTKYHSDASKIF